MIEVRSELMGIVWKVPVKVGQTLSAGDIVTVLECMKVEIPIVASTAGTVLELKIEEGSQVAEGQIVAILKELETSATMLTG
jgi:biotin carboxyl carrier protein